MSEPKLFTAPCPVRGCVGVVTLTLEACLVPGSRFTCNVCGEAIVSGCYDHEYMPGDPAVVAKPKGEPS